MKEKHSSLKLVLTVLFVVALLISNIVWAKQLGLFGGKIVSTAAIVLFPITYVLSDIFSEVYGYKRSRITCWLWFAANLFMVLIFGLTIVLPESPFWWNQEAYATILWSTPRMLFASLLWFVVWDFCNDRLFRKMKAKHPNDSKWFTLRAFLSSVLWEMVDSWIFIPLAFVWLMPFSELVKMWAVYVPMKIGYEAIILPFTNVIMKKVKKVENIQ